MKKLFIYLAIIIALFALLYYIDYATEQAKNNANAEEAQELYNAEPSELSTFTRDLLDNPNYQNIISPEELNQKLANKEDLFVYYFSADCQYCLATTPKLNILANQAGVEIEQFNILEFPEGKAAYNIQSWPILVKYEDGVEIARKAGGYGNSSDSDAKTEADYIAFLETHKGE